MIFDKKILETNLFVFFSAVTRYIKTSLFQAMPECFLIWVMQLNNLFLLST